MKKEALDAARKSIEIEAAEAANVAMSMDMDALCQSGRCTGIVSAHHDLRQRNVRHRCQKICTLTLLH